MSFDISSQKTHSSCDVEVKLIKYFRSIVAVAKVNIYIYLKYIYFRWDSRDIQHLPECMKRSFQALYETTNEVANEIQKEKGWNTILPHLRKVV